MIFFHFSISSIRTKMCYNYGGFCRTWTYQPCNYGCGYGGWYGLGSYQPYGLGYGYGSYGGLGNWCGQRWSYPYSHWGGCWWRHDPWDVKGPSMETGIWKLQRSTYWMVFGNAECSQFHLNSVGAVVGHSTSKVSLPHSAFVFCLLWLSCFTPCPNICKSVVI